MRIRGAVAQDAEELGAIACAAKASWGYSPSQVEQWRGELVPAVESVVSQPTFVAESEGGIAGFYQLKVDEAGAELEHLWIKPEFMRRGVGRALLAHAVEHVAGLGIGSIQIDSDPHAESFYIACGAMRVGVIRAPLPQQPDRIRPQLRLTVSAVATSIAPPPRRP